MSDDEYLEMRRQLRATSYEEWEGMVKRQPEVKVTEVVGAYCDDPDSSWIGPVSLFGLMPRQALEPLTEMGCQRAGPNGRFRITVEFTPDE